MKGSLKRTSALGLSEGSLARQREKKERRAGEGERETREKACTTASSGGGPSFITWRRSQ